MRSFRLFFTAPILAAWAIALPLHAEAFRIEGLNDPKLAEAIEQAMARPDPRWCEELAPLWAEAAQRATPPADQAGLEAGVAAMWCAVTERRYEDAAADVDRIERKYGYQSQLDSIALGLFAHLYELDKAVDRIATISRTNDGQGLLAIEPSLVYDVSQRLTRAKRADLRIALWSALHDAPVFGDLDPDLRMATGLNLLRTKAGERQLTPSDAVLGKLVTDAGAYGGLLTQRRYAALWPALEEQGGNAMTKVVEANLQLRMSRHAAEPEVSKHFSDLLYSLLQAGRTSEIIERTAHLRRKDADYASLDKDAAWGVNYMANALLAEGRVDEGLEALDRLASPDPATHSWVVNCVINHAVALAEHERHADAIRALDRAQPIAEKYGSNFARTLVIGQRACSHHALGQSAETARYLAQLEKLKADAPTAAVEFAMCAERDDLAIAWALEAMANEDWRPGMISDLQPAYASDTPTAQTKPQPYRLLAQSPELKAAFEQEARILPERFAPPGGKIYPADPS